MDPCRYFAPDYLAARARFLGLAERCRARLAHYPIAARGPDDGPLFVDTAYLGSERPRQLLIVLSGTHGIEGGAGSALQQLWLERAATTLPSDGGCLLVHAVNPYGFAWGRRTNEHNVDLNRNALERFPGPANPAYAQLNDWLNPTTPPGGIDLFWAHGVRLLLRHGYPAIKQAIAGGQYEFRRGLFYGGDAPQESVARLDAVLAQPAFAAAARVLALDIHTGLGRAGTYKLLVDCPEDTPPYQRMQRWFGPEAVNSNKPQRSVAYRVSGGVNGLIERRFAHAATYPAVLEFGTVSLTRVIATLRRENRAYFYAGRGSHAYRRAHTALREVFYPSNGRWRALVLARGERVLQQAHAALFHGAESDR